MVFKYSQSCLNLGRGDGICNKKRQMSSDNLLSKQRHEVRNSEHEYYWDLLFSITVSDWPGAFLDWCQASHLWHSSLKSEQKPIFLKSPPCISQWICLFHQKANFRISVTLFPIFCISSFLKMIYLVSADSSLGNTLFTVYSLTKADQLTASIPPPTSLSKCFSDTDLRVYSKKYFHLLLLAKASILLKF